MHFRNSASAGAILVALAVAGPARADLTAQDVWTSWKDLAQRYGQTIEGTETVSGDTLTVSGLTMAMQTPTGSATGALGEVAFTENADGSVSIQLAPEYPMMISSTADTGETVEMKMTLRQRDMTMTARGDAGAITYDFAAPEVSISLDGMEAAGVPTDMTLVMSAEGVDGTYALTEGEISRIEGTLNAASARFDMAATDATQGTKVKFGGEATNLVSSSSSTVPANMDSGDLGAMLAAGFTSTGKIGHGGFAYAMDATQAGQNTNVVATFASGGVDFALDQGGMLYDVRSDKGQIGIAGAGLPLPKIDIAFDESAFKIRMPLVQTEEPADFALLTRIGGLTVSDEIWGMFDPAGQLPRDPATLVVDMTGKARLLASITDPQVAQSPQTPGEIHALNVKELKLSLAGAELTGAGDFTFDNADKVTFQGMPKPTGAMALRLEGGNGLLDKLVAMGMIPQDQATGFRMMLGMFARATGDGDTMVSDISVTEDGQVLANGQRLR